MEVNMLEWHANSIIIHVFHFEADLLKIIKIIPGVQYA